VCCARVWGSLVRFGGRRAVRRLVLVVSSPWLCSLACGCPGLFAAPAGCGVCLRAVSTRWLPDEVSLLPARAYLFVVGSASLCGWWCSVLGWSGWLVVWRRVAVCRHALRFSAIVEAPVCLSCCVVVRGGVVWRGAKKGVVRWFVGRFVAVGVSRLWEKTASGGVSEKGRAWNVSAVQTGSCFRFPRKSLVARCHTAVTRGCVLNAAEFDARTTFP